MALGAVALAYALLAGLQTVGDFDTGWFLASGRYVLQHHSIPSTDVFSYTAHGQPWIYPAFSGVLLYVAFLAGGFAALSWLNAIACAGATALMLRRGGPITAVLAIIAVPLLALRTAPRGEMFTTVLVAAYASILWQYFRTNKAPLWLLPLLMAAWVNLHLGFVAGFALIAAYVALETLELPFVERRHPALVRLQRATPWLAASVAASLLNPWGPGIYRALVRQQRAADILQYVGEWSVVRINAATVAEGLRWRDPNSAYWWLLGAALIALPVALRRKQLGAAAWLIAAAYFSATHWRLQIPFGIVTAIVGGCILDESVQAIQADQRASMRQIRRGVAAASLVLVLAVVGIRSSDLLTDRVYLGNAQISLFGTGLSWWYPQRATEFLLANHLPGNLFHEFDVGGYLMWRIEPQYADYIDGRIMPFGPELFFHSRQLLQLSPDSSAWQQEAEQRGINTLLFSTARYAGLAFPLKQFCESRQWRPVYLDDVSAILVRNTPQNAALIQRLGIDCATAQWQPGPNATGNSWQARAELYSYYANSAAIYYVLERDQEAMQALDRAQTIFDLDPNLHLARGQLLEAHTRVAEAEAEYRRALSLRPSDMAWYALGRLYAAEHRYPEAAQAITQSAKLAWQAHQRYRLLGQIYVAMNQPRQALTAFANATRYAPRMEAMADPEFRAQVAEGEARAWRGLGEVKRATQLQQEALRFTPNDAKRWTALAELYDAQRQTQQAQAARQRADALRPPASQQ